MFVLDAKTVAGALPYDELIDALEHKFAAGVTAPPRAHHDVAVPDGSGGTLLLMPAWEPGRSMGVKIATVFPDNAKIGSPAVFASYFLMSAETGVPVAVLDGTELTVRRTAAASALAAVVIWGRRQAAAENLAEQLAGASFSVEVAADLDSAIAGADIISCATLASSPLVHGAMLEKGQHLDLVGAFRPDMAEADTEALRRARIFVDTREGAMAEAGDILQAIQDGAITEADIQGELSELAGGNVEGRSADSEITLFKSVGTALEDLAGAELAMKNSGYLD
jgi:ornithine cyclodeaminase